MVPIGRLAIGAATALYRLINDVIAGSAGTSRVTIVLLILIEVTSFLARSTFMSMSVSTRPNE